MNHLQLDRSTWIEISCDDLEPGEARPRECTCTPDEHFAFDSGLYAGDQETREGQAINPYTSSQSNLYEAWEAGYSCSRLTESEMIAKENEA